jgi:hypothetical protein
MALPRKRDAAGSVRDWASLRDWLRHSSGLGGTYACQSLIDDHGHQCDKFVPIFFG